MIKIIMLRVIKFLMRMSNAISRNIFKKSNFKYDVLVIGNYEFLAPEQRELLSSLDREHVSKLFIHTPENKHGIGKVIAYIKTAFILPNARNILLYDYCMPAYAVKKPAGQLHFQLWHANGAFKQIGIPNFMEKYGEKLGQKLYEIVPIHSTYDYIFVSTDDAIPYYMDGFGIYDREKFLVSNNIIIDMIHRQKKLYKPDDNDDNNKKIKVICAPTFNYTESNNIFLDFKKAVLDIETQNPDMPKIEFIELLHPKFAPNFDKISALLKADYLITDFSTICFEAEAAGTKVLFLREKDSDKDLKLFREVAKKIYIDPHELASDIINNKAIDNKLNKHLSEPDNSPTQFELILKHLARD